MRWDATNHHYTNPLPKNTNEIAFCKACRTLPHTTILNPTQQCKYYSPQVINYCRNLSTLSSCVFPFYHNTTLLLSLISQFLYSAALRGWSLGLETDQVMEIYVVRKTSLLHATSSILSTPQLQNYIYIITRMWMMRPTKMHCNLQILFTI